MKPVSSALAVLCMLSSAVAQEDGPKKPPRVPAAQLHKPGPTSDRIILTFNGDPATSAAVTWRTDRSVFAPQAEIAPAGENKQFAFSDAKRVLIAKSEDLKTDLGEARYHSVAFDSLAPATKYAYRVGDGVNWSEWFQFTTAARDAKPFTFVYFGDAQNELKAHWSRVIRESISDAPKARFLLHAGDLVNNGSSDAEWGEWFGAGGWLNGTIPQVPVTGNHEYNSRRAVVETVASGIGKLLGLPTTKPEEKQATSSRALTAHWRPQFALPEDGPEGLAETVYSFDFQGVRFICLNSNERIEEQVPWLEERLSNNPNKWTILSFHHPIYSTAKGRDNKKLRETWQPVFDRHRVDLVLQGHDHSYGRSGLSVGENLPTGASARDPHAGTVYVVSISGPKMYSVEDRPWMRKYAGQKQLYQVISIDGDRLRYQAHTATGELFDVFELRKHTGQQNQLLEREQLDVAKGDGDSAGIQGYVGAVSVVGVALALFGLAALRRRMRR